MATPAPTLAPAPASPAFPPESACHPSPAPNSIGVRHLLQYAIHNFRLYLGSPWENGYCESFNSRLRDELLNRELFMDLREAKVVVEDYRLDYNHRRPHSALGYVTPASFAASCGLSAADAALGELPPNPPGALPTLPPPSSHSPPASSPPRQHVG